MGDGYWIVGGAVQLNEIRNFAIKANGDQRYGDFPYVFHLDMVASVAARFGLADDYFLAACYVHDVLEDTDVSLEAIENASSPRTRRNVVAVTRRKDDTARSYYQRVVASVLSGEEPPVSEAATLKTCDRVANLQYSLWTKEKTAEDGVIWPRHRSVKMLAHYAKDHENFSVLREAVTSDLWSEYESLIAQAKQVLAGEAKQ